MGRPIKLQPDWMSHPRIKVSSLFMNVLSKYSALCLEIPNKIITFVVTSQLLFETFGYTFLPLENSFEFLVILFIL